MKKVLALLTMFALLFAFVGCSNPNSSELSPEEKAKLEQEKAEEEKKKAEEEKKKNDPLLNPDLVGGPADDESFKTLTVGEGKWTSSYGTEFTSVVSDDEYYETGVNTYEKNGNYTYTFYRHWVDKSNTERSSNVKLSGTYYCKDSVLTIRLKKATATFKAGNDSVDYKWDGNVVYQNYKLFEEKRDGVSSYTLYKREGEGKGVEGTWKLESYDWGDPNGKFVVYKTTYKFTFNADKTYKYEYSSELSDEPTTSTGTWKIKDAKDCYYKGDYLLKDDTLLFLDRIERTKKN